MIIRRIVLLLFLLTFSLGAGIASAQTSGLHFEISFPASAHSDPITGRVFLILSHDNSEEPRLQITRISPQLFGRDIDRLAPGQSAVIDESDLGAPIPSLRDLPPGDYYVQAVINIYSEFHRADGHVVWMHDDQWEGQMWTKSPGNLKSSVVRLHLDPHSPPSRTIPLVADEVIPPVIVPVDTEFVQRFKFQSPLLTKFWGRPIYIGATVLLPKNYSRETLSYPVLYEQGHFDLKAPMNFRTEPPSAEDLKEGGRRALLAQRGYDFYKDWQKDDFPRMLVVTFQHPNPYFDDSYAVNSVNVGPYGDAIMQELIPEIEKRYRVIKEPYARILAGGSTGGWEALALQFFHPDFFGGTWGYCPDPVTFTNVEGVNAYADTNAFYKQYEYRREPTINSIETDGRVRQTTEERNRLELVNGTHGRSGLQLDIWSAVFGPVGSDGYFDPLINKRTGEINPTVAQYWRDHFDLLEYLRRNWPTLGPKLVDKVHIYVGTMDTYQLNVAVKELQDWMKTTQNPHYEGFFVYGVGEPHCWSGSVSNSIRLHEIAEFIASKSPYVTATPWWTH